MDVMFATAGFAEMSPGDEKWIYFELFIFFAVLLCCYSLVVVTVWNFICRHLLPKGWPRLSFAILCLIVLPGSALTLPCAACFAMFLRAWIAFG
jgi:hypothetical protein